MSDFEKAFNQLSKVGLENHTELWGEPKTERAFFEAGQASKQAEIDGLKTQLNNIEQCYIQAKKQLEDAIYLKDEHRKRRCQLARELTRKSLRLTDAEFEYKRIKGLQAKDCLQIMRLTARNEKLSDEVKALRGAND